VNARLSVFHTSPFSCSTELKNGGAPPHSKTPSRNVSLQARPRFGVRQCSGAFIFGWRGGFA
jgi:hypothetical protein